MEKNEKINNQGGEGTFIWHSRVPIEKNRRLRNQFVKFHEPKIIDGHFLLKNTNKMLMASYSIL